VKLVLTAAEDLALETLRENRDLLEKIAVRLSEVELIEREELEVLLADGEAPEAAEPPEAPAPARGKEEAS
jgi:ATP-dependent Zn protease